MIKNFTQKAFACIMLSIAVSASAQCVVNANLYEINYICPGQTSVALSGVVGSGDLFTWYTPDGTGSFDDAEQLNTNYYFSEDDLASDGISILLINSSCVEGPDAVSSGTFIPYTANAGPDLTICSGGSVLIGEGLGSPSWSTSGTGTFDYGPEGISYAPIYIPSTEDVTAGTVTITLYITDQSGACGTVATDDVAVTLVSSSATIDAGADAEMLEAGTQLNGTASGVTDFLWTPDGDGTFDDDAALNAIFTPGTEDIEYGAAELVLSGDGGGCAIADRVVLTLATGTLAAKGAEKVNISPNPVVNRTEINLGSTYKGNVVVSLFDATGTEVYSETKAVNGTTIVLDQLENLKTGVYQLNIKGDSNSFTSRLVKM